MLPEEHTTIKTSGQFKFVTLNVIKYTLTCVVFVHTEHFKLEKPPLLFFAF